MTNDLQQHHTENDQDTDSHERQHRGNIKIIYILYLLSLVVGITGLIGLVMAYVYKADASSWLKDHYRWQIRTFWIGLLYTVCGVLLSSMGIGVLILLFVLIWFIVRCVKGLQRLQLREPPAKMNSWLF